MLQEKCPNDSVWPYYSDRNTGITPLIKNSSIKVILLFFKSYSQFQDSYFIAVFFLVFNIIVHLICTYLVLLKFDISKVQHIAITLYE